MCGVVGYSSNKSIEKHYKILQSIIQQSKIRGLHSFGYSYYDKKIITKKYYNIDKVVFEKTNKIIYHNRYATSGDYKDPTNNQPIEYKDKCLVFNGVLDMRTKQEMQETYNITMNTDNDGEILLQKCNNKKDIIDFVKKTTGSFAGIIMQQDKIYAIRNKNRPLWQLKTDNATFYASTKDIFKRVNKNYKPTELIPYKLYES
tara:strand:+ start:1682 stop:2287 length:606 start_codon:yes stop_codon:yes gene_type:complete